MSEPRCHEIQERLIELLEGELSEPEQARVEQHLHGCAACTGERDQLEALQERLRRDAPPDPGTAFWQTFPDRVWRAHVAQTQATTPARHDATFLQRARAVVRDLFAGPRWIPVAAALVLVVGASFLALRSPVTELGAAAYQAQIRGARSLALLAQEAAPDSAPPTQFGFAGGNGFNYFQLGHTYAEALAYAAGGDGATARARMQALATALGGVAPQLAEELRGEPSLQRLAGLEPRLLRVAQAGGERAAILFRTGVWLANIALAAVAGDDSSLQRAAPALVALRRDFEHITVAPGARRDLQTLAELLTRESLSEQDRASVRRLVRRVQTILL